MRIDGKPQFGMDIIEQSARKKSVEKAGKDGVKQPVATKTGTDAVIISGRAKETAVLSQSLRDMPEVREERIAELKMQIENGSYNVSGRDIAEKIVASSLNGLF